MKTMTISAPTQLVDLANRYPVIAQMRGLEALIKENKVGCKSCASSDKVIKFKKAMAGWIAGMTSTEAEVIKKHLQLDQFCYFVTVNGRLEKKCL